MTYVYNGYGDWQTQLTALYFFHDFFFEAGRFLDEGGDDLSELEKTFSEIVRKRVESTISEGLDVFFVEVMKEVLPKINYHLLAEDFYDNAEKHPDAFERIHRNNSPPFKTRSMSVKTSKPRVGTISKKKPVSKKAPVKKKKSAPKKARR